MGVNRKCVGSMSDDALKEELRALYHLIYQDGTQMRMWHLKRYEEVGLELEMRAYQMDLVPVLVITSL